MGGRFDIAALSFTSASPAQGTAHFEQQRAHETASPSDTSVPLPAPVPATASSGRPILAALESQPRNGGPSEKNRLPVGTTTTLGRRGNPEPTVQDVMSPPRLRVA